MSSPPFMKLYVLDYMGDTLHLSRGEHGAYLLLLMAIWRAGGKLPRDPKKLALLTKSTDDEWAELSPTILGFFQTKGEYLVHSRVTLELERYEQVVQQAKRAGKRSAEKRSSNNNGNSSTVVEFPFNARTNARSTNLELRTQNSEFQEEPPSEVPTSTVSGINNSTSLKSEFTELREAASYTAEDFL